MGTSDDRATPKTMILCVECHDGTLEVSEKKRLGKQSNTWKRVRLAEGSE